MWLSMWMGCLGHRWECNVYSHFFRQSVGISHVWPTKTARTEEESTIARDQSIFSFFCKSCSNNLWRFFHTPASFQFCTTHTIVTNKVTLHETSSGLSVKTKLIGKPELKIVLYRSPEIGSLIQAGRKCPKIWAFRKQRGWSKVFRLVLLVKNPKNPSSS